MSDQFKAPEPSAAAVKAAYATWRDCPAGGEPWKDMLRAAYAVDVPAIVRPEVERALDATLRTDPYALTTVWVRKYLAARFPEAAPEPESREYHGSACRMFRCVDGRLQTRTTGEWEDCVRGLGKTGVYVGMVKAENLRAAADALEGAGARPEAVMEPCNTHLGAYYCDLPKGHTGLCRDSRHLGESLAESYNQQAAMSSAERAFVRALAPAFIGALTPNRAGYRVVLYGEGGRALNGEIVAAARKVVAS